MIPCFGSKEAIQYIPCRDPLYINNTMCWQMIAEHCRSTATLLQKTVKICRVLPIKHFNKCKKGSLIPGPEGGCVRSHVGIGITELFVVIDIHDWVC